MKYTNSFWIALMTLVSLNCQTSKEKQTENKTIEDTSQKVIWVTLDGLRWQELFLGIDSTLMVHPEYTHNKAALQEHFWAESPEQRREKLMPFVWRTIAKEGFVFGNRNENSSVDLTNTHWFSYPGYNEILSGKADDERINSNDKAPNPNKTLLELANKQHLKGQVAAFASWDRFKYIINESRSGVPVNDGYDEAVGDSLSDRELYLNDLQKQAIQPWASVRQDVFTHNYAMEYMKRKHPKLLYISYGETDDFAHDGDYTHYILAARNTDNLLKELWEYCQSDPFYKDHTSIIITTDHGRGTIPLETWKHHGKSIEGAGEVWIAGLGNKIKHIGTQPKESQYYSNQIAPTVARMLNIKTEAMPAKAMDEILK
jgi:hypothetical protein